MTVTVKIKTAHGYLSFQPPVPGSVDMPPLQYRSTAGAWEEIIIEGWPDAAAPAPGPTPPPASGIVPMETAQYVAEVKAALEAQGVPLSGACGAFEIVSNVAHGLRHVGYGLLEKTGGNMCQGYATDVVVCPNRVDIVDVLGDSGGQNTPQWGVKPNEVTSDRWRPPVMPAHPV
jgi:hypothetical protein